MTHLNGSRKDVTSESRTEVGEKKRHNEGQAFLKEEMQPKASGNDIQRDKDSH